MKGYRINILRHGLTSANDKGIYLGSRTDYPLSDKGRAQIVNKMDEFEYPKVERVYSSPMRRCIDTAQLIYPYREMLIVDDMTEIDLGEFDGKSVDELICRDDYRQWLKGKTPDGRAPGGESMDELMLRLFKGMDEMIIDMMEEDITNAALITHSGIITSMIAGFGLPKAEPGEIVCEPGEGFQVIVTAQMWQRSQAFEVLGRVPYYRE